MDNSILEKVIRTYLHTEQPNYAFGWQGGEPTLMGLDFFKQVVSYQNHYRLPGGQITNSLQTNGTCITDEWARFLAQHQFLVGVSLDGPQHIHDRYRTYENNSGSYSAVISGIKKLQGHGVNSNILTLVSQSNVEKGLEVYRFLRDDLGCNYHQYIECVEFSRDGSPTHFSVNDKQWGDFLCLIFDEWLANDSEQISIRLFDSILSVLLGDNPTLCAFGKDCRHYLVVEHNGDLFPCDFFVEQDLKLGNVMQDRWSQILSSDLYKCFGFRKQAWHEECAKCSYLSFCAGDCQKNRAEKGITKGAQSYLCKGWKQFYNHSLPEFKKLAEKISSKRQYLKNEAQIKKVPGRNDPCSCGSGKKYKKCCLIL